MSSPPSDIGPLPRPLVAAWRAAKPSPAELRRGYARYLRRGAPKRTPLRFTRWLLGGLLLGAGLAHAASAVPWQRWVGEAEPTSAPPASGRSAASPQRAPSGRPSVAPPQPALELELAEPTPTTASPPIERAATSAPAPSAPSAASYAIQEQWRVAAEGLRTGRFEQASRALLELERSTLGGERDAARLARAQLLSSHGRGAEALALARQLEREAVSSVVRDKARELRMRLTKNQDEGRSLQPAPGINQP
jgi:hypothetical protein